MRRSLLLRRRASAELVFDRSIKERQREVAGLAADSREFEYLREAVAKRVVGRLGDIDNRKFPKALDIGCHTGHVRRALLAAEEQQLHGGVTSLTQCDMSKALVEESQRRAGQERECPWQTQYTVANEEKLPFEPYSFDVVLSCLALHWVNDLPLALFNVRHMLKDDGVFVGALLGGYTLRELQYAFGSAEEERQGGLGQHCSPSTRIADVGSLMQNVGFNLITLDSDKIVVDYADAFVLCEDLQKMGEQHAPAPRGPDAKPVRVPTDTFLAMAAAYQHLFPSTSTASSNGDAPPPSIRATFEVIYVIGWAPDSSQPKPLDRGTATARLNDVV